MGKIITAGVPEEDMATWYGVIITYTEKISKKTARKHIGNT